MKSSTAYLAAGFLSAGLTVSAAAPAADSGSVLTAPQLAISAPGPVTATFLGATQAFAQMFFAWPSATGFSSVGFFFGPSTAVGATFQEAAQQTPVSPFLPGTQVTFATLFGTPQTTSAGLSSTGATPGVATFLTAPSMSEPAPGIAFNAAVIDTGSNSVRIGFNAPGAGMPADFGGFAVRIAVSNVCVR